jgi:hypothetical protein
MDETRCANGKSGTEGEVGSWEKARRTLRRLGRVTLGPGIGISRAAEGWRVILEEETAAVRRGGHQRGNL